MVLSDRQVSNSLKFYRQMKQMLSVKRKNKWTVNDGKIYTLQMKPFISKYLYKKHQSRSQTLKNLMYITWNTAEN